MPCPDDSPVTGTGSPGEPLRGLLSAMPEAMFVTRHGRILFVNAAAERLFGAPPGALLGRSPFELFHPDSIELARLRARARQAGAAEPAQVESVLRADGETRIVETTVSRVEGFGEGALLTVLYDITELRRTQAELLRSHADLRRLASKQDSKREIERQRMANELHDELLQTLAAININVAAIGAQLQADPTQVPAVLSVISELSLAALASTRRMANELRPQILEDFGLPAALEVLLTQFSQSTGIASGLETQDALGEAVPLAEAVLTGLYRVAEEALANVAKHARARRVAVNFSREEDGSISLCVCDDGVGIGEHQRDKPHAIGLLALHERMLGLRGRLHLAAVAGGGTRVEALLPGAAGAGVAPDTAQPPADTPAGAYESLLRFLYRSPVGLLQAAADGRVEMLNPVAARLLLPFASGGDLDNLFAVLEGAAPQLRRLAGEQPAASGVVCDELALWLQDTVPRGARHGLRLSLLKQPGGGLMAVLSDPA